MRSRRKKPGMNTTNLTSKEFEKDPNGARKAGSSGPVFISQRGRRAFALLSIEEYRRIGGRTESILDLPAMPVVAEIDLDPPQIGGEPFKPGDFS